MNQQNLKADQIKVWLLTQDENKPPAGKQPPKAVAKADPKKKADGKMGDRAQKPHRMEAVGNVSAFSPDMIVHRTDYLNSWFKDLPPRPLPVPEKLPNAREVAAPRVAPSASPPLAVGPASPPPTVGAAPLVKANPMTPIQPKSKPVDKKDEAEQKDPPIELRSARRVEVWVNRFGDKNELDRLHTEGNVDIHQDKTPGNDRDVDIKGHTVDMQHYVDAEQKSLHYLIVTGNNKLLGEVNFDKVSIIADDIRIDQRDNSANVNGPGAMRILSKTDMEGKPLAKPTWIDIDWQDRMLFEGANQTAIYEGDVQAKQTDPEKTGGGKVLCEQMQVFFDKKIYLNQNVKAIDPKSKKKDENEAAKIEKVICDQIIPNPKGPIPKKLKLVSVVDEDKVNGVVTHYQNVLGAQVEMINSINKMVATGPGFVRIFGAGSKDPLTEKKETLVVKDGSKPKEIDQAKEGKSLKDDEEMKLTWVKFDKYMIGFNNAPKRSVFYSNVEVVHMPATRHDVEIDLANLPPGALYIHCDEKFEVMTQSRKTKDNKGKEVEVKWNEMLALGNVRVRSDEFDGWGVKMTYTEDKSLLVFYGTETNPARMNKQEFKGGPRQTYAGLKILYNTKTKDISVIKSLGGSN